LEYIEKLLNDFTLIDDKEDKNQRLFGNARFGLIKAQLYVKAGNLCMFKGINLPDEQSDSHHQEMPISRRFGFIYRASYFFAASLHYTRRYALNRVDLSGQRYFPSTGISESFSSKQLPDYLAKEIGAAFEGLGSALLARIDILILVESLKSGKTKIDNQDVELSDDLFLSLNNFYDCARTTFINWLQGADVNTIEHTSIWYRGGNPYIKSENFIDLWLGKPSGTAFGEIITSRKPAECAIEQLCCYMIFSEINARLRTISTLNTVIETTMLVPEYIDNDNWFDFSYFIIIKSVSLIEQTIALQEKTFIGRNDHGTKMDLETDLSPETVTTGINLIAIYDKVKDKLSQYRFSTDVNNVINKLRNLHCKQQYPVLNRLNLLRLTSLSYLKARKMEMAIIAVKEMIALEQQYDSVFHFRPSEVAFTCYEIANALNDQHQKDQIYLYQRALEYFTKSQQMYTQQNAYYESIKDMYYLFDDFNDWQINHGRALEMMTISVTVQLSKKIK